MIPSPPKTRVATLVLSVWDEPKQNERGETQTEREHLRATLAIEMTAEETIQSVERKIESAFCDFIDNCQELKGLNRRNNGCLIAPFDGQKQGLPVSIGASLWEDGNAVPSAEVKGEIHWSEN